MENIWEKRIERLNEIAEKHGDEFKLDALGWASILIDLNGKLESIIPNYQVQTIKEKFGILRMYIAPFECTDYEWDKVYDYMKNAEDLSEKTCEICGEIGELRDDSWVKCLCLDHYCQQKEGKSFGEMVKEFYIENGLKKDN